MKHIKGKPQVIISCSGKFHAFALAEQLERHGMLYTLYTSYSSIKNPLAKYLVSRRDKEHISKSKIKTFLPVAFGLKLIKKPFFWNELFDLWVAWRIKQSNADVFIGWSGMSLHSIKAAQAKGMLTILERGSSHIEYQNEILKEEYAKFGIKFEVDRNIKRKEKKEYEIADYISIPSEFVLKSFLQYGVMQEKLIKNNYGTSTYFKPEEPLKSDDIFRILYLGTSNIRKGLIYLYQALNELKIPLDKYEVWFIGRVDNELSETIKQYKKPNWSFFGHLNHYNLPKYICSCDVAIQPSLEEGLSMVIPQILSCGVPVIASTNSGGHDVIIEGKSGFIVPVRNPKAIADSIDLLYNDKPLQEKMKSYTKANPQKLSWDSYGEQYVKNIKYVTP